MGAGLIVAGVGDVLLGTVSLGTALSASIRLKYAGPERLMTPVSGGRVETPAAITAVPPIDAPTANTFVAPRARAAFAAAATSAESRSAARPPRDCESP